MEFAHAARGLGLRPIHGAELTLPTAATDAAGAEDAGLARICAGCSRSLTPTPASARVTASGSRRPARGGLRPRRGTGLPDRLRAARRARRGGVRRLREAFGRERLRVELQRPFLAGDRARNGALAALAPRLELRCVATGDVHAHSAARVPLQDAFVASRYHARRSEPRAAAARQPQHVLRHTRGDGGALRRASAGCGRERGSSPSARLRPHRRPRLPLSRRRGPDRASGALPSCAAAVARALRGHGQGARSRVRRASSRSWR